MTRIQKNDIPRDISLEISQHMAKIGAMGGRNGTGESKKRSKSHYKKMAAARKKKRLSSARLSVDNASG